MAAGYTAGAARLPFGLLRGYVGSDLARVNPQISQVLCPTPARRSPPCPPLNPDVTVLHAQAADRHGNVLIQGIVGAQKEAALAAKTLIRHRGRTSSMRWTRRMNAIVLPHFAVTAVARVPTAPIRPTRTATTSATIAFYQAWDAVARDRDGFTAWIDRHVLARATNDQFLRSLEAIA